MTADEHYRLAKRMWVTRYEKRSDPNLVEPGSLDHLAELNVLEFAYYYVASRSRIPRPIEIACHLGIYRTSVVLSMPIRALVGAKAYINGAPSFVELEPGNYTIVESGRLGTESLIIAFTETEEELPALVVASSAGSTALGDAVLNPIFSGAFAKRAAWSGWL